MYGTLPPRKKLTTLKVLVDFDWAYFLKGDTVLRQSTHVLRPSNQGKRGRSIKNRLPQHQFLVQLLNIFQLEEF